MANLSRYIEMGEKLALVGDDLRKFALEQQSREDALHKEALARDDQLRKEAAASERELRAHEHDMKKLDLEIAERGQGHSQPLNTSVVNNGGFKRPRLPAFDDSKDQIDSYLERYERYVNVHSIDDSEKAVFLGTLLHGKALDVYTRLTPTEANDYSKLKEALMRAYQLTDDSMRKNFYAAKPYGNELPSQYQFRLESYFDRWIELSNTTKDYASLRLLILREQFLFNVSRDLAVYLREHKSKKTMADIVELSEIYLQARGYNRFASSNKSSDDNPNKTTFNSRDNKMSARNSDASQNPTGFDKTRKCFICDDPKHIARNCPQKGKSQPFRGKPVTSSLTVSDDICSLDQESPSCPTADNHECSMDRETAHLNCGCTLPVLSTSCQNQSEVNLSSLPIAYGAIEGQKVKVMRDTGCNCVVIKRSLVPNVNMTKQTQKYVLIDRTVRSAPIALVNICTPFFSGEIRALCLENPICDIVIGNVPGATFGNHLSFTFEEQEVDEIGAAGNHVNNDEVSAGEPDIAANVINIVQNNDTVADVSTAMVTRSQSRTQPNVEKPLNVPAPVKITTSVQDLKELQTHDKSLKRIRIKCMRKTVHNSAMGNENFVMVNGVMYRHFNLKSDPARKVKQLILPLVLRNDVLKIGHESIMSGHLGITKTFDRISNNFYWPGLRSDIVRYCKSCDVCQKTLPRGRVTRVPVEKMPLIDTPFQRVAIDIVGPITPRSKRGNKYILTLVDYATRYPEAVALPSIETEKIAEALLQIFSRTGLPNEILSDNGSQLTSQMMDEVCKLLSIQQRFVSIYHAMANGLVEKFNGTLKQMLKKVCDNHAEDWDRYLEPLLFAYREVPQESTGFAPFELVFGRTVRGPLAILKELWSKNDLVEEVKTTYEYVFELRNRLEEIGQMARSNLVKSQERYKINYDRKAKPRSVKIGSKVLVLLPTKSNKLLLQWRGPYEVIDKVAKNDYRVRIGSKEKVFHMNMLKSYIEREPLAQVAVLAALDTEAGEANEFNNDALLNDYPSPETETHNDVNINPNLVTSQRAELSSLIEEFSEIFSNIPGCTHLIEHDIKLTDSRPIHLKPYPLPHSLLDKVKTEIESMIKNDIIEPANSPYRFPLLMVKKKDGGIRPVVDFRKLNKITIFDAEPMANVEQIYAKSSNCKFFSKMDCCKGYWQILLKEEVRDYTAFYSPQGLFRFKRMPFGLVNAGSSYNRMMRILFNNLEDVDSFVDDVLVHSDDWYNHLSTLRQTFIRIRNAKLTLKPSKCYFGYSDLEYVGHNVGQGHLSILKDKVNCIKDANPPTSKTELRSFLGCTGFYHRYIPNYAAIAAPLTDLLRKGQPNKLEWDDVHNRAFETLKSRLCDAPVLKLPVFSKQFVVRVDASNEAIGAVLLQEHDGTLHPVVYASRKLKDREVSYSVIEKECLAIVWAITKFNVYLYGTTFLIQTDHQPLEFLNKTKIDNPRVMRWAMFLQGHNFHIEVIKGKDNVGADYLSRSHC